MRTPNLTAYEGLPNHTMLRSKDVITVFGYKGGQSAVSVLVRDNLIPKPSKRSNDLGAKKRNNYGHRNVLMNNYSPSNLTFWTLGDLRKLKIKLDKGE